ncbi:hypothetical protein BTI_3626 [Burkholderia thailandensis MSMB121]|nr:hypothetical protein BTI_3626 [Burkholderia thailandensis MSMB121]
MLPRTRMLICTVLAVVPLAGFAKSTNFKKAYCSNSDYVTSSARPHFHCGKDFYTYTEKSGNHDNLVNKNGPRCNIVPAVEQKVDALPDGTAGKAQMKSSLDAFKQGEC